MKHNGSPRLRLDNQKSEVGLQTLLRCDARQHRRPSPASGDVDETWVSSQLWPASSWSAFQSIRTNNDVECWHNRLSQQLDIYQFAALLFLKVDFVPLLCVLVSERHFHLHQRKHYARVQGCLDMYWTAYSADEMTSALLKKCSYICGRRAESEQCQRVTSRPRTLRKFHEVKVLGTLAHEEWKFHGCESFKEWKFLDFSLLGSECSVEAKSSLMWTFRSREWKCRGMKSPDTVKIVSCIKARLVRLSSSDSVAKDLIGILVSGTLGNIVSLCRKCGLFSYGHLTYAQHIINAVFRCGMWWASINCEVWCAVW